MNGNSTAQRREDYEIGATYNPVLDAYFRIDTRYQESAHRDILTGFLPEDVPIGPEVVFEIEEYDFAALVQRLAEFEAEHGYSSVEMFSRFVQGVIDPVDVSEEWLEFFLLWLAAHEVRQYACP